jgi:hypothetical protein
MSHRPRPLRTGAFINKRNPSSTKMPVAALHLQLSSNDPLAEPKASWLPVPQTRLIATKPEPQNFE